MEGTAPVVSVIIATYNSAHTLQYTLASLLNQRFTDFEAWVIGDAVTDNTQELVASFNDPRLRFFNLDKNSGSQPAPNNEGIRRSKGKYIAYLGHDDLWMPWHLEKLVSFAESNKLDFTYSLTAGLGPKEIEFVIGDNKIGYRQEEHWAPPSSWLHTKALIEKVGYWREDFLKLMDGPDVEFFQRVIKNKLRSSLCSSSIILKFPSTSWQPYQNKGGITEALEVNWKKVNDDAIGFEKELLYNIAAQHSQMRRVSLILPPGESIKIFFRYFYHKFRTFSLKYFSPIARPIFQKRYISRRKKETKKRGL